MASVKFAESEHVDSLDRYGFCAFHVSERDREANHPDVGDVIHLLIDDSTRGRRIAVRLVADQEQKDGGLISIYAAASAIFISDV